MVSPSGRRVVLPMPQTGAHAAVVPRRALDAALVDLARQRGVDVREGAGLADVRVADDEVTIELDDDTSITADWLVAADGHWSPTRRALEPNTTRDLGEWHAARQYFEGVEDDRLWVLFEPDLLPGYVWVFPLPGGRANVGYGVLRADGRTGRELKELWPNVLQRRVVRDILGEKARPLDAVRAWPIPTRYEPARLQHGRVLFAGDAAGVVDPMTGEGIAQALETGMLAIESLTNHTDYARAVHRAIGRDLKFAAALQAILRYPFGARAAIRAADLTPWTRRQFARWMWEDYPRALLGTPDRWQRGAMCAPGAWHMT
jgi:flavin-dependent dehydrogenase